MNTKKLIAGVMTVLALFCGSAAYAADNSTEFGIEDDLTVNGNGGTALDPDAEIKGFTVFGATQAAYTGGVVGAGNVVVNGYLAVSSGAYFVGGSTFAAGGAYFTGVSSFSNVANVHFAGGAGGQVLKKVSGGGMVWANDDNTTMTFQTPYRIQMVNGTDTDLADSILLQNAGGTGVTVQKADMGAASMTVTGAFGAFGAATFDGNVTLGSDSADLIAANGDVDLNGKLNVDGASTFVSSMTAKGDTQLGDGTGDLHSINKAVETGVALSVDSGGASGNYAAKFYSGGSLAAWIKKK
ncbi:MAG: hypothetical protein PHV33_07555 [Elusimicrobiales bacterium]|nr:hypothetical protein [Elusimicrobiales bacterium]